jgi:hypothetical protein
MPGCAPVRFDTDGNFSRRRPVRKGGTGCDDGLDTARFKGKIVLLDRGDCPFFTKATNAQEAHATALIIVDTQEQASPPR